MMEDQKSLIWMERFLFARKSGLYDSIFADETFLLSLNGGQQTWGLC
jgi:hypothetical protein